MSSENDYKIVTHDFDTTQTKINEVMTEAGEITTEDVEFLRKLVIAAHDKFISKENEQNEVHIPIPYKLRCKMNQEIEMLMEELKFDDCDLETAETWPGTYYLTKKRVWK